jgi:hypothetical protein
MDIGQKIIHNAADALRGIFSNNGIVELRLQK